MQYTEKERKETVKKILRHKTKANLRCQEPTMSNAMLASYSGWFCFKIMTIL